MSKVSKIQAKLLSINGLRESLKIGVWTYDAFDNNMETVGDFPKCLKERVVGSLLNLLINISPSNITWERFCLNDFARNCQAVSRQS